MGVLARRLGRHLHHDRTMGASALERLVPGMDPSRDVDYVDVYRGFDGGPATAEMTGLLVVRVPASDDPLSVQRSRLGAALCGSGCRMMFAKTSGASLSSPDMYVYPTMRRTTWSLRNSVARSRREGRPLRSSAFGSTM
ncbi:hypothetical protein ABT373_00690 [Streptomyces sp. NPDC000070]|uniref:hypothetical protein n=1 Tax=Streptomyces sp. NPDC000070 TaxID=3154240 RepID=UPI003321F790